MFSQDFSVPDPINTNRPPAKKADGLLQTQRIKVFTHNGFDLYLMIIFRSKLLSTFP